MAQNLFREGFIGNLRIKNRIVLAPMNIGPVMDSYGRLSKTHFEHFKAMAAGGTGLIITGAFKVSRDLENEMKKWMPSLNERIHVNNLSNVVDEIHTYGAKVAVQLSAGVGRLRNTNTLGIDEEVTAPSKLRCRTNPKIFTRPLRIEEIETLVKDFGRAASLAIIAGVDAIELHGHEGYMLDQFSTSLWNKRKDRYGGSLRNRLRLSFEIIDAINNATNGDVPIIYRYGLTHYINGGRSINEGLEMGRLLEQKGVAAFEVNAGCQDNYYLPHPTPYQPSGLMVDMAEKLKKVVDIPVIAIGKIGYPDLAENILESGKADFIELGRPLLADPEWPNKVKNGKLSSIRPCVQCNDGCIGRLAQSKYVSCTVYPVIGRYKDFEIRKTKNIKKVLIVGGGPAGMETAINLVRRGHKVEIWEKSKQLGGALVLASSPKSKYDFRLLLNYYKSTINELKIPIVVDKTASWENIEKEDFDSIVIATGSVPIKPKIKGISSKNVLSFEDVYSDKIKFTNKAITILGGGLVGYESAYLLSKLNQVNVVDIKNVFLQGSFDVNRDYLSKIHKEQKVEYIEAKKIVEISNSSVIIESIHGKIESIASDFVINCTGFKSQRNLINNPSESFEGDIYEIGDCVKPRKFIDAIWEGFNAARII
jgi:2-enoate reductase